MSIFFEQQEQWLKNLKAGDPVAHILDMEFFKVNFTIVDKVANDIIYVRGLTYNKYNGKYITTPDDRMPAGFMEVATWIAEPTQQFKDDLEFDIIVRTKLNKVRFSNLSLAQVKQILAIVSKV